MCEIEYYTTKGCSSAFNPPFLLKKHTFSDRLLEDHNRYVKLISLLFPMYVVT
jgi:hypothetical protein